MELCTADLLITQKLRYITVSLLLLLELSLSPLSQGNQHSKYTKFLMASLTLYTFIHGKLKLGAYAG